MVAIAAGERYGSRTMDRADVTGDGIYEAMGRRWLGIGNIASRHWFCGLEPGGTERSDWPAIEPIASVAPKSSTAHGSRRSRPSALVQSVGEGPTDMDPADPDRIPASVPRLIVAPLWTWTLSMRPFAWRMM